MAANTKTTEEQPKQSTDAVKAFISLLDQASPEQKSDIAKKLGTSKLSLEAKRKRYKQQMNNAAARQFVMANGDMIRSDPDYLPDPPEDVAEKGQAAVDEWHEKWLDGAGMSRRARADLDVLADEAMTHTADMERRIDAGEFAEAGI